MMCAEKLLCIYRELCGRCVMQAKADKTIGVRPCCDYPAVCSLYKQAKEDHK